MVPVMTVEVGDFPPENDGLDDDELWMQTIYTALSFENKCDFTRKQHLKQIFEIKCFEARAFWI